MKIAFVADTFDGTNGGAVSAQQFVEGLRRKGHRVWVIAPGEPATDKLVVPHFHVPGFQWLIKKNDFTFGRPLRAAMETIIRDVDVVHLVLPFPLEWAARDLGWKHGKAVVGAFHVQAENILYNLNLSRAEGVGRHINRAMVGYFNRLAHVHCPSRFAADLLRRYGCVSQLHVISNGYRPIFRHQPTERPAPWKDRIVIASLGRHAREKRQDLLIRATQLSRHRERIQLVLTGRGPRQAYLRKLARALPMPPVIDFLPLEQVVQLLNYADLYVHTSDVELESMATLEAIACGCVPIISDSPHSATPQFALCPESLFCSGDPAHLAHRMDFWIDHPETHATFRQRYLESAAQHTLDASVDAMEQMYAHALRDAHAATRPGPG